MSDSKTVASVHTRVSREYSTLTATAAGMRFAVRRAMPNTKTLGSGMRTALLFCVFTGSLLTLACGGSSEPARDADTEASEHAAERANDAAAKAEDKADRGEDKADQAEDHSKDAH